MSDTARRPAACLAWRDQDGPGTMMIQQIRNRTRSALLALAALAALVQCPAQAAPAQPIDGDLATSTAPATAASPPATPTATAAPAPATDTAAAARLPYDLDVSGGTAPTAATATPAVPDTSTTYHKDDLIGAAEGVFGKGASGLAGMIEDLLRKQGEPNGYIVGREGGGALIFGLRYGSGTLHHKIEGERPVYWTGPSIGFDAGANAASAFVLVYNLQNTEQLFQRFPAIDGSFYYVGGAGINYQRRDNITLAPIRLGVGLRAGASIGYVHYTKTKTLNPF